MDIIYELLLKIKERPGMYLGKKSIIRLNMFISGYYLRQYEIDYSYRSILEKFGDFVNDYCLTNARAAGWATNIYRYAKKDDEKAFDLFFELLDEFLKTKEDKQENV